MGGLVGMWGSHPNSHITQTQRAELGGHADLGDSTGGRLPLPLRHLRPDHHLLGRPAQEGPFLLRIGGVCGFGVVEV